MRQELKINQDVLEKFKSNHSFQYNDIKIFHCNYWNLPYYKQSAYVVVGWSMWLRKIVVMKIINNELEIVKERSQGYEPNLENESDANRIWYTAHLWI